MPDYESESGIAGTGLEEISGTSLDRSIDRSIDRVEMERLREMLREQQEATLRAINTAADLKTRLSTAQTEVKKIGKQYHSFSKQAREAVAEKATEVEIAKVKSERHKALRELEKQKQERKTEATWAAAQLAQVQKELTAASVAVGSPRPKPENRRVRHVTIALATGVAIVGSAFIFWRTSFTQFTQSHPTAREYPSKSPPVASSAVVFPRGLSPEPGAALASAMTQLDIVLSSFPGRKPEDILREASQIDRSCRMQWNDGNPSLVFGGGASNSLTSTITHCAEAVKRLH